MIEQDGSDSFKVVKLAKRPQQQGVKLVMPEVKPLGTELPLEWFTDEWPTVKSAGVEDDWPVVGSADLPVVGSGQLFLTDQELAVKEAEIHGELWNKFWGKIWDEVEKEAIREERRLQTERSRNQEATRLLLLALEASRDPKN